jgi:acylphosphatase
MLAIIYISSAVQLFSDVDLTALLKQSWAKNSALEITGILLYRDGDVMQLLEGPDEAVMKLAQTIYADQRHSGSFNCSNGKSQSVSSLTGRWNFRT